MFVGTCTGCVETPTPVYYWNPYITHAYSNNSAFQIANILRLSQSAAENAKQNKRTRVETSRHRRLDDRHELLYDRKGKETGHHTQRDSYINEDVRLTTLIDFSRTDSDKCTLQSALEPLQALCSEGPRGYRSSSPSNSHCKEKSPSPGRVLKFGINQILSEEFGKEKTDKENSPSHEVNTHSGFRQACECTYDSCQLYTDHVRYPAHALSAVHALQPPKYHTSPSGTDVLPGPYSILNTDVNVCPQSKRKRSWSRAVFSNLQRKGLEKRFEVQKYVTKPDRRQLAAMLGLTDAQVKVWFQNRRMKWRHAQQQINVDNESSEHIANDMSTSGDNKENARNAVAENDCENSMKISEESVDIKDSEVDEDVVIHTDQDSSPGVHSLDVCND